ncbi:hypothetical protein C6499_06010 [Candidatus Poribacteria bacterium]|nr:MAG: hypothetical protein C6499_06010 [Candidatus Poribacteria bacterium]
MHHAILSSRGFITGLAVFVLIVGGSLFYSWHIRRTSEAELQRSDRFLRELGKTPPAEATDAPTDIQTPGFVDTPDENTDTLISDAPNALPNETENLDVTDAFLLDDFVSWAAPTEDAPVSPYGFGPYPKLPPEFPDDYWNGMNKEHELIARVWMKLLEQGVDVAGGTMQNGLVYPTIRGTVYIEWDYNGTERYISRLMGDPNITRQIRDYHNPDTYPLTSLTEDDLPAGIQVFIFPDGGIDPYEFLGLSKSRR